MNQSWIQARVNYSVNHPHQVPFHNNNKLINIIFLLLFLLIYCPSSKLILQANCKCSDSIALDDIRILRDKSCNEITPTTTPNPPTTTSSTPSAMDCTFEHGEAHFWPFGSINQKLCLVFQNWQGQDRYFSFFLPCFRSFSNVSLHFWQFRAYFVNQVCAVGFRRSVVMWTGHAVKDFKWTSLGMDLSMTILSEITRVLNYLYF